MADDAPCLEAALWYATRGWPVLPIKSQSKEPLSRRGVVDASSDSTQIRRWFAKWPSANVGIACGLPGPQVLDIDDLVAGHTALVSVSRYGGPDVATARGRQFYLTGTNTGTVGLGWGELRGTGSYVVAPPSIHPSGRLYVWLIEPTTDPLPPVPGDIVPTGKGSVGTGELVIPELIPYGQRHEALKEMAVRFVRSGITDVRTLEEMLRAFFEARFVPTPKPRKDEFLNLAAWAARTNIANRERTYADFDADTPATKAKKQPTGLEVPPRGDAPLKEHREYLRVAGGWPNNVDIDVVKRDGARPADSLEIRLTNGQIIEFESQDSVAKRGHWARTVTMFTGGIANPVYLNDLAGQKVLRSLCILADAPVIVRRAQDVGDAVDDFVRQAEDIDLHDLTTWDGRYNAIDHCRAREPWMPPKAGADHRPALLVCRGGSGRYVRGGELRDWLNFRGLSIPAAVLPGRVGLVGLEHVHLEGREARRPDRVGRGTNHMVAYRLPPVELVTEAGG